MGSHVGAGILLFCGLGLLAEFVARRFVSLRGLIAAGQVFVAETGRTDSGLDQRPHEWGQAERVTFRQTGSSTRTDNLVAEVCSKALDRADRGSVAAPDVGPRVRLVRNERLRLRKRVMIDRHKLGLCPLLCHATFRRVEVMRADGERFALRPGRRLPAE